MKDKVANITIKRFDPTIDKEPYFKVYEYPLSNNMTVLDVLNYIHENIDPTLSYSYSCRNKHCGLCGIIANGKSTLSCKCKAIPDMTVEPLDCFDILKDLVIDRTSYEKLRPALRLSLERKNAAKSEPEKIPLGDAQKFKKASRCIECYCCVSACPIYKKSPHSFLGPAGIVLEARHAFDPRDDLDRDLILKDENISNCIQCGLCTKACLMDVDPAEIIKDLIKRCY